VRWAALGLTPDGWVPAGKRARLLMTAPPSGDAAQVRISLAPPAGHTATAVVRLGDARREVRLADGKETDVTLVPCPAARGAALTGSVSGDTAVRVSGGSRVSVRVTKAIVGTAQRKCGPRG
jgi:hypothetical protein